MLQLRKYLVKERVAFMKLSDTYDIFDPETGQQVGIAKEVVPGYIKALRFLVKKQLLPTSVEIRAAEDAPAQVTLRRGVTLFRSKVHVFGAGGVLLGHFHSKLLSLGGGFHVYDNAGTKVAEVKGDWKGWNFKLLAADGRELGTVTKKWAGIGKELFTSADNYMIAISDGYEPDEGRMGLLLAAGLAIDIVFKEKQ